MAVARKTKQDVERQVKSRSVSKVAPRMRGFAAVLEEARRAGLLDGERSEHVSFRVPRALMEAAARETGVTSPTELCILALANLAQPDPIAEFLTRTHGRLGRDHKLDF